MAKTSHPRERETIVNDLRRLMLSVCSAFLDMYKGFPHFRDDEMNAKYLKAQMKVAKNYIGKIEADALLLSSSASASGPIII